MAKHGGEREGAGRPRGSRDQTPRRSGKEGWQRIGTLIAPDAKASLDQLCEERGESIGEVITWLVRRDISTR
jgi:hypothetical protein